MASFIRALFGARQVHRTESSAFESVRNDDEQAVASASDALLTKRPYHGQVVPPEASLDPEDSKTWYGEFHDLYLIVIAKDQERVIMFPSTLQAIDGSSGQPLYEDGRKDDRETPHKRIKGAARIYEYLTATGDPWPQTIVRFAGRTTSGFYLERLSPGPVTWRLPHIDRSDAVLALYQRWALQLLSALCFVHKHNVILNILEVPSLWMRDDFSIAVANMINAGSLDCGVSAGYIRTGASLESPWSPSQLYHSTSDEETYPGDVRSDLFDWATCIYGLFSGGKSPIDFDMDTMANSQEYCRRYQAIAAGSEYTWPQLDDHLLGSVLIRAWTGQYASAADVLQDVKIALTDAGRVLSPKPLDDLLGFDWQDYLEVSVDSSNGNSELRVK